MMKKYIRIPYLLLAFFVFAAACKGPSQAELPKDSQNQAKNEAKSAQNGEPSELDPYFTESKAITSKFGPTSIVRNILQDSKGNIWLATWLGIIHYDGKTFTNFTNKEGLRRFRVFSMLEDSKGNIWFGTIGAGIYLYDGKSFTNLTTKDGLVNDRVGTIYEDKAGKIWIGTTDGLSIYDGKTFQNHILGGGYPHSDINSIVEDKNGRFWIATRGDARFFDPSTEMVTGLKSFTKVTNQEGSIFTNVRCIIEDSQGHIWMGGNDGLNRYDGRSYSNLAKNFTGYIYEDKKGNIWTSSEGKDRQHWLLSRYDSKTLSNEKPIPTEIKEKQGMFFGIIEDSDDAIWLGSLRGVYRYDGDSFNYFKDPAVKEE